MFSRNRAGNEAGDVLHTRLADPRSAEILMARLRDQDAYSEAKQRLNSKRWPRQIKAMKNADPNSSLETPNAGCGRGRGRDRGVGRIGSNLGALSLPFPVCRALRLAWGCRGRIPILPS